MTNKYLPFIAAIFACTFGLCPDKLPLNADNALFAEAQVPSNSEWSVLSKVDRSFLSFLASTGVLNVNNGAIGQNRQGFISVGNQRYSSRFIAYGILTNNTQLIDIGLKSIEYPLAFQQADGSFVDYSPGLNGKSHPGSVAFYLHDVGHSLVLCKNSRWFQESSQTAFLRARIAKLQSPLTKSLDWLIQREADLIRGDGNGNGTNRLWADANAYYLSGRALNRIDAVRLGEKFATLAIQQQSSSGAFLEKNGYDSSYQGVSLQLALLFYTNLSSQASQRPIIWQAIQRGINLQLKSILPSGEVSTLGNTRVSTGGETYLGQEKKVDYLAIVQALQYYYQLTQDPIIKSAADRAYAFYRKPK